MTFREALGNEMREAGRGAAANLEGRAGEYRRADMGPAQTQAQESAAPQPQTQSHEQTTQAGGPQQDAGEARQKANEAQAEHHEAAHADYEAQHEAAAAEQEATQETQAENDGPEYGD